MATYIGKVQIGAGTTPLPIGSTLYGTAIWDNTNNTYNANSGNLANIDTLLEGLTVHIKFPNYNIHISPTLKIGNFDAKPIHRTAGIIVGTTVETSWPANAIVTFTYDGTAWVINSATNNNTTYTVATGDSNGQVKIIPSNGDAYNVNVKGLQALAYKDSLVSADIPDNAANTSGTAGSAYYLINKSVDNTTLHNSAGSFTFSGEGNPWNDTDWVGIQVGSNNDKFQITAGTQGLATLSFRQNDSGGTNSNWSNWQIIAHAEDSAESIGNTTQPIYMTSAGVLTAGTALGASAYHEDNYFALASHTHNWSFDITDKPTTLSGYGISDAKIDSASGEITLGSNTITPVTSINGQTGAVSITAADLGLSRALRFIGITSTQLTDDSTVSTLTPASTNSLSKTTNFVAGDVVIYSDYEFVWLGSAWEKLGDDSSFKVKQTAISKPEATTNQWVSAIGQDINGNISVDYANLDTSGTWSGNATTATKWLAAQEVYVTLGTASTTTTIQGGDLNTAQTIGVDGTLNTGNGGTGNTSFTANRLIYTETDTKLNSTTSIYASTTAITINGTEAPANSGNFQVKGTSTFQHIYTQTHALYDIGTDTTRWNSAYLATSLLVGTGTAYNSNSLGSFIGPGVISSCVTTSSNNDCGYYLMGDTQQYARLYIQTIGTTSTDGETYLELGNTIATGIAKNSRGRMRIYHTDATYTDYLANGIFTNGDISDFNIIGATSNTANTVAWTNLILGNNNPIDTANNAHSQGNLRLYSSGSTYTDIQSQAGSSHIFYLPNYDSNMYAVHASSVAAVGGNTEPVYIAENGLVTALTYTPNRLYASGDAVLGETYSNSFEATGHYADSAHIGINMTTQPTQNLQVTGTTYITSYLGVGVAPDSSILLTVQDSFKLVHNTTNLVHLLYNNNDAVHFIPHEDETGKIGLSDHRWVDGYFSNILTVGSISNNNLNTGVQANGSGTLLISTSSSSSINIDATLKNNKGTGKLEIISNGNEESILLQTQNTDGSKIHIASGEGEILLQSTHTTNTNTSVITITAAIPSIMLNSTTKDTNNIVTTESWAINNADGIFSINNQKTPSNGVTCTELRGTDENWYFEGHVSPLTNNTWNLGTAAAQNINPLRWKALYLGTADTYGDPYQPIYWNNGVPDTVSPVQYFTWALTNISTSSTATNITYYSDAFTNNTYVLSLVVTQGQQYLESPIEWDSTTNGRLELRANITKSSGSGTDPSVTGYIILARGCTLTPTTTPPSNL